MEGISKGGKGMELVLSITELSNLTGKTRPTIYKYVKAYVDGNYDDLPYSFIQLFNLMDKDPVNRNEVIDYCNSNFKSIEEDVNVQEIISLIKNNLEKLNLENIKKFIEEEISKWTI